eukprot:2665492-Rhodomonas_salina.1
MGCQFGVVHLCPFDINPHTEYPAHPKTHTRNHMSMSTCSLRHCRRVDCARGAAGRNEHLFHRCASEYSDGPMTVLHLWTNRGVSL